MKVSDFIAAGRKFNYKSLFKPKLVYSGSYVPMPSVANRCACRHYYAFNINLATPVILVIYDI